MKRAAIALAVAGTLLGGCATNFAEMGQFTYNPETKVISGSGIVGLHAAEVFADALKGYETCPPELTEMGEVACNVRLAASGGSAPQRIAQRSAAAEIISADGARQASYVNAGVQVAGITAKLLLGTAIVDASGDFLTALASNRGTQSFQFGDVIADDASQLSFQLPVDGSMANIAEGDVQGAFGDLIGEDNLANQGNGIGGQPSFEFPREGSELGEGATVNEAAPTIITQPEAPRTIDAF